MEYSNYYEESEDITLFDYGQIRKNILREDGKNQLHKTVLRKLRFINHTEEYPKYCIGFADQDEKQIYVEKKSRQNEVFYRTVTFITREECEKIICGEIEWMKNHKQPLLNDLYLQMTINGLCPGYIIESEREILNHNKKEQVVFFKSIKRAAGNEINLFSEQMIMINCLGEEKVRMNYRRKYTLPDVIAGILQQMEEQPEAAMAL